MITLGISAFYHDSAVAVLQDERILFALQEERISRKKADASFPTLAIKCALSYLSENLQLFNENFVPNSARQSLANANAPSHATRERERERERVNPHH